MTFALPDRGEHDSERQIRSTSTTCPYCGVGCELDVGVKDERIVQIRPTRDAIVNKGHLCVKGRYAHGFVRHHDRLHTPLVRRGERFVETGWDEALALVARELETRRFPVSRVLVNRVWPAVEVPLPPDAPARTVETLRWYGDVSRAQHRARERLVADYGGRIGSVIEIPELPRDVDGVDALYQLAAHLATG